MQPFNVPFGETWEVLEGTRDRVGDRTLEVVATLESCVFWQNTPAAPQGTYPTTARDTASLTGTLAVPRTSDDVPIDARMRRVITGVTYQVVGPSEWDQVHPLTGWDPGYKTFTLKAVAR